MLERGQQGHTIAREGTERYIVIVMEGCLRGRIGEKYRGMRWKRNRRAHDKLT